MVTPIRQTDRNTIQGDGFEIILGQPMDVTYPEEPPPTRRFVCVESLPWGNWTCMSPHCPTHAHRSKVRHATTVNDSRPEDGVLIWAITLPVGKYLLATLLSRVRQEFNRQVRRTVSPFEYWWVLHYEGERYNLHLLAKTRTEGFERKMRELWRSIMLKVARRDDLSGRIYCQPCFTWEGYVDYCLNRQDEGGPQGKMPPRHLYRRYTGKTDGFDSL